MTTLLENHTIDNTLDYFPPAEELRPRVQPKPTIGLEDVFLGEPMAHRGITVIPLFLPWSPNFRYLGLSQALEQQVFRVAEMSLEGVVPELMVENSGHLPVLLMDGEELVGIKQNRVLNASVMVPARTQMPIPVSCVEQNRWQYSDPYVTGSDNVLEHTIRTRQMEAINRSLESNGTFHSDQNDIWYGVHQLIEKAGTYSARGAMRDVYQQKRIKLNRHCKAFPVQPGQHGLLVLRKNKPLGFDLVSRPEIYRQNHCKLVKSYVLDSLLKKPRRAISRDRANAIAGEFLTQAIEAKPKRFDSPGIGRVQQADASGMIGSVLIHDESPIHATFLAKQKNEPVPPVDIEIPDQPSFPDLTISTTAPLIEEGDWFCDPSQ